MNAWVKFAAFAATAIFATGTAYAQDEQPTGFYGELNVGVANLNEK